jgi:hypothetical protein
MCTCKCTCTCTMCSTGPGHGEPWSSPEPDPEFGSIPGSRALLGRRYRSTTRPDPDPEAGHALNARRRPHSSSQRRRRLLNVHACARARHTHPALWIRPQHTYLPQRLMFCMRTAAGGVVAARGVRARTRMPWPGRPGRLARWRPAPPCLEVISRSCTEHEASLYSYSARAPVPRCQQQWRGRSPLAGLRGPRWIDPRPGRQAHAALRGTLRPRSSPPTTAPR